MTTFCRLPSPKFTLGTKPRFTEGRVTSRVKRRKTEDRRNGELMICARTRLGECSITHIVDLRIPNFS